MATKTREKTDFLAAELVRILDLPKHTRKIVITLEARIDPVIGCEYYLPDGVKNTGKLITAFAQYKLRPKALGGPRRQAKNVGRNVGKFQIK